MKRIIIISIPELLVLGKTKGRTASDNIVQGAWVGVQSWVDESDRLLPAS